MFSNVFSLIQLIYGATAVKTPTKRTQSSLKNFQQHFLKIIDIISCYMIPGYGGSAHGLLLQLTMPTCTPSTSNGPPANKNGVL